MMKKPSTFVAKNTIENHAHLTHLEE